MALTKGNKFETAMRHLKEAIEAYESADKKSELQFLALSKAFEIAVEYSWRELKMRVENEGLEAQSPKAAVKEAAKLGFIEEPEHWLVCIDARNNSVHDYFGISEQEYATLAEKFLALVERLK